MASPESVTRPDRVRTGLVTAPRFVPRRQSTPLGIVTIDLLRHLRQAVPVLPGADDLDHAAWHRHSQQGRDVVLVATCQAGASRQVLGTLELCIEDDAGAAGPVRRGTIDRLFVHPRYRRLGIGTRLMRAAIGFARDDGLAALREFIPNLFAVEGGAGGGHRVLHEPGAGELGGMRSLGTTAKACVLEDQACLVVGVTRDRDQGAADRHERIGAILELPGGPSRPPVPRRDDGVRSTAVDTLLARLRDEIVTLAGTPWLTGDPTAGA